MNTSATVLPVGGDALEARLERARLRYEGHALRWRPGLLEGYEPSSEQVLRRCLELEGPSPDEAEAIARVMAALAIAPDPSPAEARLVERLGLSPAELDALWLLVAPQLSAQHRAVVDALAGAGDGLPLPLARDLVPDVDLAAPDGALRRHGLVDGEARVRATARAVELVAAALPELPRVDGILDGIAHVLDASEAPRPTVAVEEAVARRAKGAAWRWIARGAAGAGARALATRIADGRPVIEASLVALAAAGESAIAALAREARLVDAVVLLRDAARIDELAPHPGARVIAWLADPSVRFVADVGARAPLAALLRLASLGATEIELALPPPAERALLWRDAIASFAPAAEPAIVDELVAAVAARPVGVDAMREALVLAGAASGLPPSVSALARACDEVAPHRLGALATRIAGRARWEDLVVSNEAGEAVADFIAQVQASRRVLDELGLAERLGASRGLVALVSGPAGTGKTMIARLVSQHLGVEPWRVDVASLLARHGAASDERIAELLAEARALGVALVLDEADALWARRVDAARASGAVERGIDAGWLLDQLDEHPGVVMLCTRLAHGVDKGVLRRVRCHVQLGEPDAEAREALWRAMLPSGPDGAIGIDVHALAEGFPLVGAAIREAVLRAAYRAAAEERAITQADLESAARVELGRWGR